jgi:hypothetical protein
MSDLKSPLVIKIKGLLFLFLGIVAAALILVEHFEWRVAFLLAVAIWSFCRFYYFAFYVIEKYVDPSYRFAGLTSFVRYLIAARGGPAARRRV